MLKIPDRLDPIISKLDDYRYFLVEGGRGGGKSNAIARCHSLGKVMQHAMKRKGFYALEFISEKFDWMSEEDKIKTILHELMHIPKSFGGGFIHHNFVTRRNVDKLYNKYIDKPAGWFG